METARWDDKKYLQNMEPEYQYILLCRQNVGMKSNQI